MLKKDIDNIIIGGYPFTLEFKTRDENKGCDGYTWHCDRKIVISTDLDDLATILVIRHEIVHAILGTQGRCYQKKFDLEEMCEFIAYKLPEINDIMTEIDNSLNFGG